MPRNRWQRRWSSRQSPEDPPADLTTITKRHGKFPTKTIESTILGDIEPVDPAHGTREMPMWGPIFRSAADRDVATLATANLVKYLESLPVKLNRLGSFALASVNVTPRAT